MTVQTNQIRMCEGLRSLKFLKIRQSKTKEPTRMWDSSLGDMGPTGSDASRVGRISSGQIGFDQTDDCDRLGSDGPDGGKFRPKGRQGVSRTAQAAAWHSKFWAWGSHSLQTFGRPRWAQTHSGNWDRKGVSPSQKAAPQESAGQYLDNRPSRMSPQKNLRNNWWQESLASQKLQKLQKHLRPMRLWSKVENCFCTPSVLP